MNPPRTPSELLTLFPGCYEWQELTQRYRAFSVIIAICLQVIVELSPLSDLLFAISMVFKKLIVSKVLEVYKWTQKFWEV